jgi:uncharacterized repeat protein (TIGR01451 family)
VNDQAVGVFNSAAGAISGLSANTGQGIVCLFSYLPQGTITGPHIQASMKDVLVEAINSDRIANPGEYIDYLVAIRNVGGAGGVFTYSDLPGANTVLVNGSVTTSQGSVLSGNLSGQSSVTVDLGDIAPQDTLTVAYRVRIVDSLPAGVVQVENQGLVSGDLPDMPTDDPDTPAPGDPTETLVTASPILSVFKTDTLLVDADNDNSAGPGDTLQYSISVANSGNQAATAVRFVDQLDANTTLVAGSVQVVSGAVVRGNSAGDSGVEVNIGVINPGESFNIVFQAAIQKPLAMAATHVRNQSIVTSLELPPVLSDDIDTQQPADATVTPLSAEPKIAASKEAMLLLDQDNNHVASPGDTLGYTVTIANPGNGLASGVVYTDTIDANTTLLTGSLETSSGVILSGANSGERTVRVNIGALSAGSRVTISYRVTVNDPLPSGVFEVVNQGVVRSNERPGEPTDDPNRPGAHDPTRVVIVAVARLHFAKRSALFIDADGNNEISPGDALVYLITVANTGNAAATNVIFRDTVDPKTTLVDDSVRTSQGIVASGNTGGDRVVEVLIDTLAPNATATIGFQVTINQDAGGQVVNQALVYYSDSGLGGANPIELSSDDPETVQNNDPTVTPIVGAPSQEGGAPDPDPTPLSTHIFLPLVDH